MKKLAVPMSNIRYEILTEENPKPNGFAHGFQPITVAELESDEEIIERLRERFEILHDMTMAVKKGDVRAMIVCGPPGVGKSYGIESALSVCETYATLSETELPYHIIKGKISPLGLYSRLYEYRNKKDIVIFDDCDVYDESCLDILKAALDSSKRRVISWNSTSHLLKNDDLPQSFEYQGGCIFVTNIKFDLVRSKTLREHLKALESRCHYIDLTIDTDREKILRIKQLVNDGMLNDYRLQDEHIAEVIAFIEDNAASMRELSLRMVLKVADLRKTMQGNWQRVARITCMKNATIQPIMVDSENS